jgi:hypothetical protein
MTFTSIPKALKAIVADLTYLEAADGFRLLGANDAERVILAFLNACIEQEIGRVSDVKARNSERVVSSRFILNLGATDDTA